MFVYDYIPRYAHNKVRKLLDHSLSQWKKTKFHGRTGGNKKGMGGGRVRDTYIRVFRYFAPKLNRGLRPIMMITIV